MVILFLGLIELVSNSTDRNLATGTPVTVPSVVTAQMTKPPIME